MVLVRIQVSRVVELTHVKSGRRDAREHCSRGLLQQEAEKNLESLSVIDNNFCRQMGMIMRYEM